MSKSFIDKNFILETKTAEKLYFEYAEKMPIIDYHCHLDPVEIAKDRQWENLSQIWLYNDHYKWRAMRANGINEKYITGNASDWEKFEKWAGTVPYTLRNPLYHWTHLELKKPFKIDKLLNQDTCREIYEETKNQLQKPEFSAKGILKKWNVEYLCTTDDPVDTLEHHLQLRKKETFTKMLPTWRPDRSLAADSSADYNYYLDALSELSAVNINTFDAFIEALRKRHDFFESAGCRLSDIGLEEFYAEEYSSNEINRIFLKIRSGNDLSKSEVLKLKSSILYELAVMNYEKGWVQQFHYGVIRNNNSLMFEKIGPNTGFDSMSDFNTAKSMSTFLDRLASSGKLTKTIIYNLNPKDNGMLATMTGNFQDGSVPGKIQFGSGWWFLDQKKGIEDQINTLSLHGLLSRFVGMLTDSRSFLSFSRHEYFRRILCNILGNDMEKGLIPDDIELTGKMVQDICYNNAKTYFNF